MKFISKSGNIYYVQNNQFHCPYGPAVSYSDGTKIWYYHDKYHCLDGPAIIYSNGSKEWWYHDTKINCKSTEEFIRIINLKAFW